MSAKVTPWFPGNVKPVRKGVYMRDATGTRSSRPHAYSWWDGARWGLFCLTVERADLFQKHASNYQSLPWRGLAEKP